MDSNFEAMLKYFKPAIDEINENMRKYNYPDIEDRLEAVESAISELAMRQLLLQSEAPSSEEQPNTDE